jgi:hypothetical protein
LKLGLIVTLISLILGGASSDMVYFDGVDPEDTTNTIVDATNAQATEYTNHMDKATENKDASSSSNVSNSKWYVERMKFAYEKLMEHEFKWLEEEKEEYEKTKVLPENSLHANIAEFREQDAKEMIAINEALNKFNLNENPDDIGSSDNKRSIVEEDQTSTIEENKKSKIVAENEINVTKNVNSNNK